MARKGKKQKLEGVYVYQPGLLHFLFFLSSALLVVLWFAMVGQDYAREWKYWQKEFYQAETERVEEELFEEQARIEGDLAQLEEDLAEAEASIDERSDRLAELQAEKQRLDRSLFLTERNLKFEKARQDERRYSVEKGLEEAAKKAGLTDSYEAELAYAAIEDPTNAEYPESERRLLDELEVWRTYREAAGTIEALTEEVKALKAQQAILEDDIDEVTGRKEELLAQRNALTLGIQRLEDRRKKVDNRVSNIFRNLPLLDFLNPQLKIQQTVVDDIVFDVNFMKVQAVDRCTTCHVGIDKPGYEDMPQPLRTHPKLVELFNGGVVANPDGTSTTVKGLHPFESFGCTVCHVGRGRATSFQGAAHTPNSHEQEEEWKEKYGWYDDHYWDYPQLARKDLYSSCYQCHAGNPVLEEAEEANDSRALFTQAGCYSCHKVATGGFTELPKPGPNLSHIAAKTDADWTWKWLEAPRDFREETLMPHYWGLLNNSRTDEDRRRNEVEIHSIVEYLYATSDPLANPYGAMPRGDAARGEEIVNVKGCLGCHQVGWDEGVERWERRHHGPNLAGLGSKVEPEWLFAWLKNPRWYHAETKMPDLRLTDQEAADVVAHLMGLRMEDWEQAPIPELDEDMLRAEVKWRLMETRSEAEAEQALTTGDYSDVRSQKLFLAEKLIGRYGCFSCHDMNGPRGCGPVDEGGNGKPCFNDYGPIGVELTQEADKAIEKLVFGHVHIPHTKRDWFYTKLRTPRVWDVGTVVAVKDRLRMPSFGFSPQEAEMLTSFIQGLKKPVVEPSKMADQDPLAQARNQGHRLIETLNCRGCHVYQAAGGAIQDPLQRWLVATEDMDEATASGYFPPEITGEGWKVQSDWLVEFLLAPWPVRPWVKTVMPTFHFNQSETNTLVGHFNAASQVETFEIFDCADVSQESIDAGRLLASDQYFKCGVCHIQGDQFPGGTADRWAPNFAAVPERLRHDWIMAWLDDPAVLQPGTKMPNFFFDERFLPKEVLGGKKWPQIQALSDWLRCAEEFQGYDARNAATP